MADSKLTAFLYILARDYLPPQELERIMQDHVSKSDEFDLSNKALAACCRDISSRLVPVEPT